MKANPITEVQLRAMFPNASASTRAANAQTSMLNAGTLALPTPEPAKAPGKRRKQMNKTEAEFARMLDARKARGEILSWEYEGLTLRWGKLDPISYTPDFCVIEYARKDGTDYPALKISLIETKGGHIWPKDMAKFKQARNEWPLLRFEMWQKAQGEWRQLL